jgi:hypothetical protein
MRTILFITFALLAFTGNVNAQTFSRANVATQSSTESITIANKVFAGGTGKTGAVYITRTSAKSGNKYKQYLGYRTGQSFDGQPVYRNKAETEYCIYELGRTGYPKKVVLTVN